MNIENENNNNNEIKYFNISAKKFEVENVGELFSPLKQRFAWYFTINNFIHKVELINNVITNQREIILDNKDVFDSGLNLFSSDKFFFRFEINDCELKIKEFETFFELIIDNKSFKSLYLNELKKQNNIKDKNEIEEEFINYLNKKKLINKDETNNPFEKDFFDSTIKKLNNQNNINTPFD